MFEPDDAAWPTTAAKAEDVWAVARAATKESPAGSDLRDPWNVLEPSPGGRCDVSHPKPVPTSTRREAGERDRAIAVDIDLAATALTGGSFVRSPFHTAAAERQQAASSAVQHVEATHTPRRDAESARRPPPAGAPRPSIAAPDLATVAEIYDLARKVCGTPDSMKQALEERRCRGDGARRAGEMNPRSPSPAEDELDNEITGSYPLVPAQTPEDHEGPPAAAVNIQAHESAARSFCERLALRAEAFRSRIGPDSEIGIRLSPVFGEPLYVEDIGYEGQDMIVLLGRTKHGACVQVVQHIAQANIWFVAMDPRPDRAGHKPPAALRK